MDLLFAAASILGRSPEENESFPSTNPSASKEEGRGSHRNLLHRKRCVTYEDLRHITSSFDPNDPQKEKKLRIMTRSLRSFCIREFFYSTIDEEYYYDNEFITCLEILGLGHLESLSRFEWSIVRGVMGVEIGRPRRFSPAFLVAERMKLQAYRTSKRLCSAPSSSMSSCESTGRKPSSLVQVGDVVSVCDLNTCTIAKGLVLSSIEPQPVRQQRSSRGRYGNHYTHHNTSSSSHLNQQQHHQWETRKAFLVQLDRQELGIEVYDDIDIAIIHNEKFQHHEEEEEEEGNENIGIICEDIMDEDVKNLLVFSRQLGMVEHARERKQSMVDGIGSRGGSRSSCTETEESSDNASRASPSSYSDNATADDDTGGRNDSRGKSSRIIPPTNVSNHPSRQDKNHRAAFGTTTTLPAANECYPYNNNNSRVVNHHRSASFASTNRGDYGGGGDGDYGGGGGSNDTMDWEREKREREIMARCTAAVRQVWPECLIEAQKYVDRNMDRVVGLMHRENMTDKHEGSNTSCAHSSSHESNGIKSVQSHLLSNGDRAQSNGDRAQSNDDRAQSYGLSSQEDGLSTNRSDDGCRGDSHDGSSDVMLQPRIHDLIVKCIAGILLLRGIRMASFPFILILLTLISTLVMSFSVVVDAHGKWIAKYAEPVLSAVVEGISEGMDHDERDMMMTYIRNLLDR